MSQLQAFMVKSLNKASITQWLTQGRMSKRILDCFREQMETIDQICLNTAQS